MSSEQLLDIARAEIAQLESVLADWREVERLALKLTPGSMAPLPPTPPAAPTPRPEAPRRPRSRGAANGTRREEAKAREEAILGALSTRGPLSPGALVEATGLAKHRVSADLRKLAETGRLVASGSTANRTYDVARNGDTRGHPDPPNSARNGDAPALSPRVAKLEAEPAPGGEVELEDRIIAVLERAGGRVALSEVEHQLHRRHGGCDRGQLEHATRRLHTHGLVIRDDGGGLRLALKPGSGERPLEEAILDAAGLDEL